MALHALVHMATRGTPATSAELATCMGANPVQVRRTMAGLRDAGLVASTNGRGGGFCLACASGQLTLRDVYMALDEPALFAVGHRRKAPDCLVDRAVNAALEASLEDAQSLLLERFAQITLEGLVTDCEANRARRSRSPRRAARREEPHR